MAQLTFQSVVGPLISLYIETCEYILGRAKKAAAIVSSDDNKESGGGGVKGGDGGNPQSTTAGGGTSMPGGAGGIISFLVLDLIECMVQSRTEYDGVVVYSGAKGIELTEAVTRLKSASGFFFKEFFDGEQREVDVWVRRRRRRGGDQTLIMFIHHTDLKPDVANAKNATLPPDGTVHEITSKTLNTIKKMIDYHFIIDTILAEGWGVQASFPISSFSSMCSESIDQLVLNLESRSRLYISKHKTPTLAPIFLMNNFQYCLKQFGKDRRLADLLDGTGNFAVSGGGGTRRVSTAGTTTSAVGIQSSPTTPGRTEEKFTKMVKSQKELYLNSWKHMYDYLMDSTYIQNGVMVKTLSKQQRDVVKDKFKVERLVIFWDGGGGGEGWGSVGVDEISFPCSPSHTISISYF